jgi:hypothetical protein
MAKKLILNNRVIFLNEYKETLKDGLIQISIDFPVTSEEYHEIATLLYEGEFEVMVPEKNLKFRGRMIEYSTSITNLYISGQAGIYKLSLLEKKD